MGEFLSSIQIKAQAIDSSTGIDFIEAQELWEVRAVVVRSDRTGEVRYARIAMHCDGNL